ncbi:hypothetical protein [Calothrix sp. NIES-2098]|uniref:hypothetical protein n=1 Tax=Calothrix sp. NIES-2098 TaxID=1954171 RepID=UPI000B5ED991|nr:hypothetical protein NIES2098_74390 [Calothrix sp. NIES-2098]
MNNIFVPIAFVAMFLAAIAVLPDNPQRLNPGEAARTAKDLAEFGKFVKEGGEKIHDNVTNTRKFIDDRQTDFYNDQARQNLENDMHEKREQIYDDINDYAVERERGRRRTNNY